MNGLIFSQMALVSVNVLGFSLLIFLDVITTMISLYMIGFELRWENGYQQNRE